jgi:hypothetical protein
MRWCHCQPNPILCILYFFQCVQYVDGEVLVELVPRLTDLIKSGIGIGTKVKIINQYYIKRFLHERNKTNVVYCYEKNLLNWEKLNFVFLQIIFVSSPDPKCHVNYCHHFVSASCPLLAFHILIFSSETTC